MKKIKLILKNQKSNSAITLIALIITIIVLLILAGVTLNMVMGENGLFGKAKESKEEWKKAEADEILKTKSYEVQIEKNGNATLQDFVNYLEKDKQNEFLIMLKDGTTISGEKNIGNVNEIFVHFRGYIFKINSRFNIEFCNDILFINASIKYKEYKNGKIIVSLNVLSQNEEIKRIEIDELGKKINEINSTSILIEELEIEANKEYEIDIYTTSGNKTTKNIKYEDKDAPNLTINIPIKDFTNFGTLKAEVNINDETEVDISRCKWVINSNNNNIGTDYNLYTDGIFEEKNQTISKELTTGGKYYIHILVTDVIGNVKEYISDVVIVKSPVYYLNTVYFGTRSATGWKTYNSGSSRGLYGGGQRSYCYCISEDVFDFSDINELEFNSEARYNDRDSGAVTIQLISTEDQNISLESNEKMITGSSLNIIMDTSTLKGKYYIKIILRCRGSSSNYSSVGLGGIATIIGK